MADNKEKLTVLDFYALGAIQSVDCILEEIPSIADSAWELALAMYERREKYLKKAGIKI